MTPADILPELRGTISDQSSVRWTDTTLRGYMLAAEIEIVRRHPEAQYATRLANSTPVLLTDNTSPFTISTTFRQAMIHYVAFRVFSEDSEDMANADRSKTHYALFEGSLK